MGGTEMFRRLSYLTAGALAALVAAFPTPASADILTGYHQIVNAWSWECLNGTGAPDHDFAEVWVKTCVDGSNQRWSREDYPDGLRFKNQYSGLCLGVLWRYEGDGNGDGVVERKCDEGYGTTWELRYASGGWNYLTIWDPYRQNWKCLDKSTGRVIVWGCNREPWQKWSSLG
jgi:hypothetical protein